LGKDDQEVHPEHHHMHCAMEGGCPFTEERCHGDHHGDRQQHEFCRACGQHHTLSGQQTDQEHNWNCQTHRGDEGAVAQIAHSLDFALICCTNGGDCFRQEDDCCNQQTRQRNRCSKSFESLV